MSGRTYDRLAPRRGGISSSFQLPGRARRHDLFQGIDVNGRSRFIVPSVAEDVVHADPEIKVF
jgi:hypothetical protein